MVKMEERETAKPELLRRILTEMIDSLLHLPAQSGPPYCLCVSIRSQSEYMQYKIL